MRSIDGHVMDIVIPARRSSNSRNQRRMCRVGQINNVNPAAVIAGKISNSIADLGIFHVQRIGGSIVRDLDGCIRVGDIVNEYS